MDKVNFTYFKNNAKIDVEDGAKMRLKHVKNAEKIIEKSLYIIENPETYKGNYDQLFQNKNSIYIEIGMGKGDFIIENAKRFPNINFIGIEKFDSVIVRAVQKLENQILPNLKLIKIDAFHIDEIFDHDVSLIYLNFSDPWPKFRHEKRRLSSKVFLEKYDSIFKGHKKIIMKTDNRLLFEFSIQSFTDYGYKIKDISLNLYEDHISDNIPTEYEKRFHEQGCIIYKIDVEKQ